MKSNLNLPSSSSLGSQELSGSGLHSTGFAGASAVRSLHLSDTDLGAGRLYTTREEDYTLDDLTAPRRTAESPDLGLGSSDNGQMSSLERVMGHTSNTSPRDLNNKYNNANSYSSSRRSNSLNYCQHDTTHSSNVRDGHTTLRSNRDTFLNASGRDNRTTMSRQESYRTSPRQHIGVVISSRTSLPAGLCSPSSTPPRALGGHPCAVPGLSIKCF